MQDDPKDAFSAANVIQVYRNQHKWQDIVDAVEAFDHNTHTDHTRQRVMGDYIFALMCLNRPDDAYTYCKRFLGKYTDDIDGLYYMGVICGMQGRCFEAIACMYKYLSVLAAAKANPAPTTCTINTWGAMEGAFQEIGVQVTKGMRTGNMVLRDIKGDMELTGIV